MTSRTGARVALVLLALMAGADEAAAGAERDYPIRPADMTNVTVTGGFWLPRFETNRTVTVKVDFAKCEETGRNDNFRKAARGERGSFVGCPFDDSDVYKVIEGAAYTLASHPDAALERYLDALIADIARAQEKDGYLYTARTLGMGEVKGFRHKGMLGSGRWSNTGSSHEFYNMGHAIEAGVAYYQATGKRTLLDVARRAADMMDCTFGSAPGQIRRVPGHEEIELALCKLYRATGERRYLALAERLLSFRGSSGLGTPGYAGIQNHLPVLEQREAIGHAVRAGYLYTGMADVAALTGDERYRRAIEILWGDVVGRKLHLNGGIGAHRQCTVSGFGPMGEAIGAAYDLPNANAYLETCAAIANAFWNDRLFRFTGDGKYVDVLERIIYNGFLSGISLSGDEFFYPNPLASAGGYRRSKWFGCSCCPVNVVRFIPQIAQYAYSTEGNAAYWNLFIESDVRLALASGLVALSQKTAYPWKGTSEVTVSPAREGQRFTLKVRVPGWAVGRPVPSSLYEQTAPGSLGDVCVRVNGEKIPLVPEKGYCAIDRAWRHGDRVSVSFAMPVRRIRAEERVVQDRGRLAVECGPIVWCAEGADNGGKVLAKIVAPDAAFSETTVEICGQRFPALRTVARSARRGISRTAIGKETPFVLIPSFAWCHRGAGEMQTWFPTSADAVQADAASLDVAFSHLNPGEGAAALFDGRIPQSPQRAAECPRATFWPHCGTEETVTITLPGEEPITGVDLYWFDDAACGGRCRAPDAWKIQVQLGPLTGWADAPASIAVGADGWSRATLLKPEPGVAVRIVANLRKGFSAGLCELKLR